LAFYGTFSTNRLYHAIEVGNVYGCTDNAVADFGRPIIGAKQSADYQLIQKVPETRQKPAVHTV